MRTQLFLILPIMILFTTIRIYSQAIQPSESLEQRLFSTLESPSYITLGEGFGNIDPLVYEACFAPEFRLSAERFPNFGFLFTPQIILRMYDQYSHPVRTPSYMPRGTLFYHFNDERKVRGQQFVFLTLGHHSNGQEGSFFKSDSVTINKIDGSFSSNYLTGGYEYFNREDKLFNPVRSIRFSSTYYLIDQPDLRELYGRLRFFTDVETTLNLPIEMRNIFNNRKAKSKVTGSMHLGWIALDMIDAKPLDIKRLIFSYTLSYQPAIINNVALFARFYYGQDYYNINLDRTLTTFQFGLSIRNFSF